MIDYIFFFQAHSLVARGEGVVHSDGSDVGHHFVHLGLNVPRALSQKQQDLMLAFANASKALKGERPFLSSCRLGIFSLTLKVVF